VVRSVALVPALAKRPIFCYISVMKKYVTLLIFNISAFIILLIVAVQFGGTGGNCNPAYAFIGIPIIGIVSFIWLVLITIRYRKTIFENKWAIIPAVINLVISVQALRVLYFLIWNRYLR
jgi:hypothetical protein